MSGQEVLTNKYIVRLSIDERERLNAMINPGKHPARFLLKADLSHGGAGLSDSRIAEAPDTSTDTVLLVITRRLRENHRDVLGGGYFGECNCRCVRQFDVDERKVEALLLQYLRIKRRGWCDPNGDPGALHGLLDDLTEGGLIVDQRDHVHLDFPMSQPIRHLASRLQPGAYSDHQSKKALLANSDLVTASGSRCGILHRDSGKFGNP